jgi:hypothetical protein
MQRSSNLVDRPFPYAKQSVNLPSSLSFDPLWAARTVRFSNLPTLHPSRSLERRSHTPSMTLIGSNIATLHDRCTGGSLAELNL